MKVFTMTNNDCFKIHLESENQEESHIILKMSRSVKSPVESYGYVDRNKTWAWFLLPLKKGLEYKAIRFGNKEKL